MGVDIHMYIVKNGQYIAKDIFDGRNSEWFANLQSEGNAEEYEYDYFPAKWDKCPDAPSDYYDYYDEYCYGFRYIKVSDYMNWFQKYRPDKTAGWVNTYDKWAYEVKHILPCNISRYLYKNDNINDMHFIEIENFYDCSLWLFTYLRDNNIDPDAYIVYCFDN